jgi:hypothetical protein
MYRIVVRRPCVAVPASSCIIPSPSFVAILLVLVVVRSFCSPCHSSALPCVVVAPFVVSTSIAPYEQWLAGRVVVLCDMAPVVVQEQHPLPPCEQWLAAAA